jgi:uncharacterized protein YacL
MEKMENPVYSVIFMILISTALSYYLNSVISLKKYITNNLHKFYMSAFMGLQMGLLEIGMIFVTMGVVSSLIPLLIIIFFATLFVGYKLYTLDFLSNEQQFMLAMIEHHSLALSMANQIKSKTTTAKLNKIVDDILTSQEDQIQEMYELLKS